MTASVAVKAMTPPESENEKEDSRRAPRVTCWTRSAVDGTVAAVADADADADALKRWLSPATPAEKRTLAPSADHVGAPGRRSQSAVRLAGSPRKCPSGPISATSRSVWLPRSGGRQKRHAAASGEIAGALSVPGLEVRRRTVPTFTSTAQMSPVFSLSSSSSWRSSPVKKMTRPSSDHTGPPTSKETRVSCVGVPPRASTTMSCCFSRDR